MRMRPHVHRHAGREYRWAELIDEYERPDHHPARAGQHPPDLECAEVMSDRLNGGEDGHSPGALALTARA
ncbi:MAG: hypothetical protein ACKOPM_16555 [Novosphingobium sp.]